MSKELCSMCVDGDNASKGTPAENKWLKPRDPSMPGKKKRKTKKRKDEAAGAKQSTSEPLSFFPLLLLLLPHVMIDSFSRKVCCATLKVLKNMHGTMLTA